MEYCEKGDLKQLIQKHLKSKEPIEENVIWKLLTEITLALRACHYHKDNRVIHRDLKPANIF